MSAPLPHRLAHDHTPEHRAQTALHLASATTHDALAKCERIEMLPGQLGLIRASASLLEIALDYQAASDYGQTATAEEIVRQLIGLALTREP